MFRQVLLSLHNYVLVSVDGCLSMLAYGAVCALGKIEWYDCFGTYK